MSGALRDIARCTCREKMFRWVNVQNERRKIIDELERRTMVSPLRNKKKQQRDDLKACR